MMQTHFVTPSGLDAEGHGSTAYDMALLAAEAMQNEEFAAAVGQTPCARLCRLYFEGTRLCGSVLALYFFITFLSTALLLLAGNGGFV